MYKDEEMYRNANVIYVYLGFAKAQGVMYTQICAKYEIHIVYRYIVYIHKCILNIK